MCTFKQNWRKPRGIDNGVHRRFSDAQHQLPEQLENKAHAAQQLPQVPGPQHQGAWSATDVQHMSLRWDCSQRLLQDPQSHCGKGSPTVHWSHQSQRQTVQLRKWIDSSFAHFVCVNKAVKLRQNNNKQNKTKHSAAVFYSISVPNTYGVELLGSVQAGAGSSSAHQWNSYTGFGNKAVWMPLNLPAHFWKPCHSC